MPQEREGYGERAVYGTADRDRDRSVQTGQTAMYQTEHWLAWLMAAISVTLGTFGLLLGFGVIDGSENFGGLGDVAGEPAGGLSFGPFSDGLVLLLPGIAAAVLAYSMHDADHHRFRAPFGEQGGETSLWTIEHFLSVIAGLGAIGLGALCILVGFDVFDQAYDQSDGILWGFTAIGASVLSVTLHSVRHHQVASEEDYIVRVVENRVRSVGLGSGVGPVDEPRTRTQAPYR